MKGFGKEMGRGKRVEDRDLKVFIGKVWEDEDEGRCRGDIVLDREKG